MGDNEIALSEYRLENAKKLVKTAKLLLEHEDYLSAVNRTYYALYHAIRSVLALDKKDFKKHSGTISEFMKCYIKTGIFDAKYSEVIQKGFDFRNKSDYNDFYIISKTDTANLIKDTEIFIEEVNHYITERIDNSNK